MSYSRCHACQSTAESYASRHGRKSALAGWLGIGRTPATISVSAVCTALAVYGYRPIHQYERWIGLFAAFAFRYLTYLLLTGHHAGTPWHPGHLGCGGQRAGQSTSTQSRVRLTAFFQPA